MEKSSKLYIAGHRGLVGSALVRRLTTAGYTNLVTRTSRELDLRRQADVEAFFERERPEYVFLAAAKVGGILANSTYKAEFIYDNIMIAANIIHASYRTGVKKLLNLGSSCIYPKFAPQPMKEEHLLTGLLEPTNEPYAIAKIAAIKLCRYYNEQYKTNYISAMPTNLYGPGDNFDLMNSHVLPAMIRKMHLAHCLEQGDFAEIRKDLQAHSARKTDTNKLTDQELVSLLSTFGIHFVSSSTVKPPTSNSQHPPSNPKPLTSGAVTVDIWGTGEPYREFLYVDDLANACLYLMENHDAQDIGEFINVGTGEDIRIRDLVELVRTIVGYAGSVVYDSAKPDGTLKKLLDVGRIRTLGWAPTVSLEEGIRRTYAWYRSMSQV